VIHIVPGEPGHLIAMYTLAPEGLRLSQRRPTYHRVQAQIVCSETYALFEGPDDPAPFALLGGAELPSGELDIWFVVRPGGLSTPLLLALIRFGRAMLSARPPAVTYVEGGNAEGARLARLCGFERSAGKIGSYEEWRR
jgi:hypothetical protein